MSNDSDTWPRSTNSPIFVIPAATVFAAPAPAPAPALHVKESKNKAVAYKTRHHLKCRCFFFPFPEKKNPIAKQLIVTLSGGHVAPDKFNNKNVLRDPENVRDCNM